MPRSRKPARETKAGQAAIRRAEKAYGPDLLGIQQGRDGGLYARVSMGGAGRAINVPLTSGGNGG